MIINAGVSVLLSKTFSPPTAGVDARNNNDNANNATPTIDETTVPKNNNNARLPKPSRLPMVWDEKSVEGEWLARQYPSYQSQSSQPVFTVLDTSVSSGYAQTGIATYESVQTFNDEYETDVSLVDVFA
jgi:hypothetical protein